MNEVDDDEEQLKILTQTVADLENDLNTELEVLTTGFELQNEEVQQQLLPQIKDIWYRKKYMLRIRESINRFASR